MSLASMDSDTYPIQGAMPEMTLPIHSPSIRREPKLSGNNLRTLYQSSGPPPEVIVQANSEAGLGPTTPVLPPTPPHADGEEQEEELSSSEATKVRSLLVTPVHQLSPPTPDNTPPRDFQTRHFLGPQPSIGSTRAESFKTAHEEIPSDAESSRSVTFSRRGQKHQRSPILPPLHTTGHKPSPLAQASSFEMIPAQLSEFRSPQITLPDSAQLVPNAVEELDQPFEDSPVIPQEMFPKVTQELFAQPVSDPVRPPIVEKILPRTGPSLRERLEESQSIPRSSSIDRFANIIGWSETVQNEGGKRWSGISTSTVEAIVIDTPRMSKKRGTLRHVSKNESLRSASSPLPNHDRGSILMNTESPHRLIHKNAKLSNRNRESFSSERSRSFSVGSSVPPPRMEIIRVAVIPDRVSSLQGSATSSRRHSQSYSTSSAPLRHGRGPESQRNHSRKRTVSETGDRGRDRYYPPQVGPHTVPQRSSSLSAPTSRMTSRANSLTAESVRSARRRAEQDLRLTLSRMESDREAGSQRSTMDEIRPQNFTTHEPLPANITAAAVPRSDLILQPRTPIKTYDFAAEIDNFPAHMVPGTKQWADMRPTSFLATPFSAPSFFTASPEISEARMVSFFPHNNESIQIIEPNRLSESNAVHAIHDSQYTRLYSGSPFRDPRIAPSPPRLKQDKSNDLEEQHVTIGHHTGGQSTEPTYRRPLDVSDRTDSFAKNLLRTISLKHARNRKADQDLDSRLHPMWRPRPFWDDPDALKVQPDEQAPASRGIVQNSVGISQQRNTLTGPVGLMHRISNRRRNQKLAKQSSYTSLHRLRTGRKLYRIPGLGVHLQVLGLKDIQDRMSRRRLDRQDGRREKRREAIRKSIGPSVVSTGDSRFPVETM